MNQKKELNSLIELESQIERRIKEFNTKRGKNQWKNRFFSLAQIILSGFTTLLVAINANLSYFCITVITLVVSSLASISGQLLSKFMYQERMAMNIATVCALYELRHKITMDKKKQEDDHSLTITLQEVDLYQQQYQNILNTANGQWQKYIQDTKAIEK
ncbi:SLATT domain-containing protein [Rahnella bonaserana]|uniref:SLATT domain-containing protein n=1 Tax=Rahnella bonaserana TaxID=2816248 RepID=UPI0024C3C827|nr:SLATT domain-containing protein [Rahnella bonaserana]WHZ39262.1 SLATT domain-containing protein [Rahnella bonaserana]